MGTFIRALVYRALMQIWPSLIERMLKWLMDEAISIPNESARSFAIEAVKKVGELLNSPSVGDLFDNLSKIATDPQVVDPVVMKCIAPSQAIAMRTLAGEDSSIMTNFVPGDSGTKLGRTSDGTSSKATGVIGMVGLLLALAFAGAAQAAPLPVPRHVAPPQCPTCPVAPDNTPRGMTAKEVLAHPVATTGPVAGSLLYDGKIYYRGADGTYYENSISAPAIPIFRGLTIRGNGTCASGNCPR